MLTRHRTVGFTALLVTGATLAAGLLAPAQAAPAALPGPSGMSVVATIAVGEMPQRPVLDAKHNRLYVPDAESPAISVIDLTTNEVTSTIVTDKKASDVDTLLLDEARNRLFAITGTADQVVVIDTRSNGIRGRIKLPEGAHDAILDTASSRLYVLSGEADRLQVINTNTLRVIRSAKPPANALSMALDRIHGWLYFDGYTSKGGVTTVISTRTWRTVFTIPGVSVDGGYMTLDVPANRMYASLVDDEDPGTMEIVDTKARTILASITVGMWPREPVLDAATSRVYLATSNEPKLAVIDTQTNASLGLIDTGGYTSTPVLDPDRQRLFAVSNTNKGDYLAMISTADNTTTGLLALQDATSRPVLDLQRMQAYVAGSKEAVVTVVALPR